MAPVSVAEKVGTWPETGLLYTSFSVMVTVEEEDPLATTGPLPVMVEVEATTDPAVKLTVPPDLETGVAMESVFVSAAVDFKVQVEIPEALEEEQVP